MIFEGNSACAEYCDGSSREVLRLYVDRVANAWNCSASAIAALNSALFESKRRNAKRLSLELSSTLPWCSLA